MNSCGFQQDADNNVSLPPQPTLTNKYDTRKFNNNNNCETSNTHTNKQQNFVQLVLNV